jgi:hypothetical protein
VVEISRVPLVERLADVGYATSVVTTYNIHFPFFESVVLRRLRAAGCQHNVVLADAVQLAVALGDPDQRPRLAGTAYTVIPVRVGGAFHPKVVLRLGKRKGSLHVGSHNLSFAGFAHNHEITTHFAHQGEGRGHVATFQSVIGALRAHVADAPPGAREAFEAAVRADWLRGPAPVPTDVHVLASHADPRALWTRTRALVRGRVRAVLVVGPFFDAELALLARMTADLQPESPIVVAIEPEGVSIDAARAKASTFRFRDVRGLPASTHGEPREAYLHAKLIWIQTDEGELLVAGSANPTASAMLADLAHRNAEVVVARWSAGTSTALLEAAGLDELLAAPDVSEARWSDLAARMAAEPREEPRESTSASALVAETVEAGLLVAADLDGAVELRSVEDQLLAMGHWERVAPGESIVRVEAVMRDTTGFLIARDPSPRMILVHRTSAISDLYTSDQKRALRSVLGRLDEDPKQLEALLTLTEKVIFDSGEVARATNGAGVALAPPGEGAEAAAANPVSLAVDAQGRQKAVTRARRAIASGDIAVLLDALIRRLGQGLADASAASLVESAERQASDEGDPDPADDETPRIDHEALAQYCRRRTKTLVKRTLDQLAKVGDDDPAGARRFVVQLAAVLSLVRALTVYAHRREWRFVEHGLVDRRALGDLLRGLPRRLVPGGVGVLEQAIRAEGELFEEVGVVVGLVAWSNCALHATAEAEARRARTERPRTEALTMMQQVVFLAPWLDEDAAAIARDAVRATGHRDIDHESCLATVLGYVESARRHDAGELAPVAATDAGAGDLVLLASGHTPRARIVVGVALGARGAIVTVVGLDGKTSGWLADRVQRLVAPRVAQVGAA